MREALQQKQERIQRLVEAQHSNLEQVLKRAGGSAEPLAAADGRQRGNVQESAQAIGRNAQWETVWPCSELCSGRQRNEQELPLQQVSLKPQAASKQCSVL